MSPDISINKLKSLMEENLSLGKEDDEMNNDEYNNLIANLEILKTGKYNNNFVSKLHDVNLYYKQNILFDIEDKKQIEIKDLLYTIINIDFKKKKFYYCLKTKELLQNILEYIENNDIVTKGKKPKKHKIIIDDSDDEDIVIKICKRKKVILL